MRYNSGALRLAKLVLMWTQKNLATVRLLLSVCCVSSSSFYRKLSGSISHTFFALSITWGQSKISSYFICIWCESEELRGRKSSRFPCVTLVVETFSSDWVEFRTPSNINDGAHLRKQPTVLTCTLFPQKSSTTDFQPDSKCGSDRRCRECGV